MKLYNLLKRLVSYNKRLVDTLRCGLLVICPWDQLKHYNSQRLVDVNILTEVPKDAKLKAWLIQTLEVSGLTKELAPKWCFVAKTKWSPDWWRGQSQDWSLKCSKKWRGWGDLELLLTGNCKVAKWQNILQDAVVCFSMHLLLQHSA